MTGNAQLETNVTGRKFLATIEIECIDGAVVAVGATVLRWTNSLVTL